MISIKEACRYQNFLMNTIDNLNYLLSDKTNLTTITEKHFKNKSNSNAVDEVIEEDNERIFNCKANDISYLMIELIDERARLAMAISKAKSQEKINWVENGEKMDLDSAVDYNKTLRTAANKLTELASMKDKVIKTQGSDYLINNEGNQNEYYYPVEKTVKVDFNKKVVYDLDKKLLDKMDKISTAIEEFMLLNIVDFTPSLSLHATLEDVILQYEEKLANKNK